MILIKPRKQMSKPWENDSCDTIRAYHAIYSVPQAAALWCGVPEKMLSEVLNEARQLGGAGKARAIWTHPDIPCLEPRSRAISLAIDNEDLPCGREDGEPTDDYVAYERRHLLGRNLKEWILKEYPNDKPAFLFDEIERGAHTSISTDSYKAIKSENDGLKARLEKAIESYKIIREEKVNLENQLTKYRERDNKSKTPGDRAETTYQHIIASLLYLISGKIPGVEKHPGVDNESQLIEIIETHFKGYAGLSKSNLARKLPEARKNLEIN